MCVDGVCVCVWGGSLNCREETAGDGVGVHMTVQRTGLTSALLTMQRGRRREGAGGGGGCT